MRHRLGLALIVLPVIIGGWLVSAANGPAAALQPEITEALHTYSMAADTPTVSDLVRRWFGPDADDALAIMECESAGDPDAIGDAGASRGLFQIAWGNLAGAYTYPRGIMGALGLPPLTKRQAIELLHDPAENIRVAYWTWRLRGGWDGPGGWGCAWVLGQP